MFSESSTVALRLSLRSLLPAFRFHAGVFPDGQRSTSLRADLIACDLQYPSGSMTDTIFHERRLLVHEDVATRTPGAVHRESVVFMTYNNDTIIYYRGTLAPQSTDDVHGAAGTYQHTRALPRVGDGRI